VPFVVTVAVTQLVTVDVDALRVVVVLVPLDLVLVLVPQMAARSERRMSRIAT